MQAAWLEVRRDSDFPTATAAALTSRVTATDGVPPLQTTGTGTRRAAAATRALTPSTTQIVPLGGGGTTSGAPFAAMMPTEQSGLPGGLVGRPLRQAVLVIRQDRAVLGDDAPWRRAGTACWRRRRPCCWPAPPWRPWRRRPPHNRLKVPSRLIDQKSCGRQWPRWMPWRAGMHQRVDAVDRACQVVGLRRSAWSSSWAVSIGRKSSTLACTRPRPGPVPPPGPGCRRRRLPAPSSGVAPCWSVDARVVAGQGCLTWTTPSRESRPNSSTFGL
jgi:hypothetical protein